MLSVWAEFLKLARQELGTQVVETWLKCVSIKEFSSTQQVVLLAAPNQFIVNWVTRNYLPTLKNGLARLLNVADVKVNFCYEPVATEPAQPVIEPVAAPTDTTEKKIIPAKKSSLIDGSYTEFNKPARPSNSQSKEEQARRELSARKMGICSKYCFETLVVGSHNHLAYSASVAISKGAIKGYNPLFIYGATGLGKTHLLNCIGNETRELRPNAKIVYKTSDKFVDEFIKSIRFDKIDQFKEKYCTTDLLLIDDIQFLSQKEQTQEIFFHIFNNMHQNNKQIVLSSDLPPNQIMGLQDRLKSRFGWGLIADIQPPAFETRIAILLKKAEDMKMELSRHLAAKIAAKVSSNIRELEGLLTRVLTLSLLSGQPISEQLVDQELVVHHTPRQNQQICPNTLLRNIAKCFGVTVIDIKSEKREKSVAYARQVAMYLLRTKTSFALKTIGELVGGRNHSTVMHAIENIEKKIKQDAELAGKIQNLLENNNHPMEQTI